MVSSSRSRSTQEVQGEQSFKRCGGKETRGGRESILRHSSRYTLTCSARYCSSLLAFLTSANKEKKHEDVSADRERDGAPQPSREELQHAQFEPGSLYARQLLKMRFASSVNS